MIPLVMMMMIRGTMTLTGPSSPFFFGGGGRFRAGMKRFSPSTCLAKGPFFPNSGDTLVWATGTLVDASVSCHTWWSW